MGCTPREIPDFGRATLKEMVNRKVGDDLFVRFPTSVGLR